MGYGRDQGGETGDWFVETAIEFAFELVLLGIAFLIFGRWV